ncbi:DUF2079 domain-containing protein [Lacisediminihabitans changchengi]|uniref:DUF2079 domain-containing protein n=1 Tax=Lacisediminihabitans changchengi TaxID=2787634 RepID=A0A934W4W0_9MICO|nr:DUF2079 domain-containing protein [Lacisediminihabitans changchengi]MBK4346997.1 DUF2079 domain-containing protein [Lacisediminihabitans changchengi]MBK4347880.1 DUF2079 domain-containing protein [Lacisediminihabitans changchengi]
MYRHAPRLRRLVTRGHQNVRIAVRRDFIAIVFVLGLFAMYSTLAVRRQLTFHTAGWDLGIFEQAVRNYSLLRAPISLLKGADVNLLGDHFHPILMVLAPLYAIAPSPVTLLVAQSFLFALAAWPLVAWARTALGRWPAVCVGLGYGFSFGIAAAAGFDFHEIAFAVPLIAFSLSALGRGRLGGAAIWALPLVLVKEDLGLSVVAVIGCLIFCRGRHQLGVSVAIIGAAASILEILVILPAINGSGGYHYWAKVSKEPLLQVLGTDAGGKLLTLLATIAITGFLALRSPLVLAAVPTLLWRFASNDPSYWGTNYHYSAVVMPVVFAAMIDGGTRIRAVDSPTARGVVRGALALSLIVTAMLIPSHALAQLVTPTLWQPNPRASAIDTALAMIPSGASVSASDDLVPQLTSRDDVTLFGLLPAGMDTPTWIVVDPHSTRHFAVTRKAEHRDLLSAQRHDYRVVFARDGITLLRRT